jgi:bifunctional UDP-N-acetylglucosamine pyrophosphorylase/glucosamine-1-phosphate N-acetyltransferase/UDP-N-acetylglucosamine pyrophosphorylase
MNEKLAVIILAAGLGTRMKSDKAKVLHTVCGKTMISYVLQIALAVEALDIVVVVGHQADQVKAACLDAPHAKFAYQEQQLGTGHAVMCALPCISDAVEQVVILCGDVPMLRASTISALLQDHMQGHRALSLLAVDVDSPTGYGRIKMDAQGRLSGIVEEKDASAEEKRIKLVNAGIYCVDKSFLKSALGKITPDNAQNELYLTDIIEIGYRSGENIGVLVSNDVDEVAGINTVQDLQFVEKRMAERTH